MTKMKYYRPTKYAKHKGYDPSYITSIKSKLVIEELLCGGWIIKDCKENDKILPKRKSV